MTILIPRISPKDMLHLLSELEIADRLTVLSDQDVLLIEQLTKLQSEKSALMNDLLTGRVRVTLLLEGDNA
jgi:hypothetical protein